MNHYWVLLAVVAFTLSVTYSQSSEPQNSNSIRIGSFNIRSFGRTKVRKPNILNPISKVVQRYDIILILEIRDKFNKVIPKLLQVVNSQGEYKYNYVISKQLGKRRYKERCAYIFRTDTVKVKHVMNYKDDTNVFEREPFVVQFQLPTANIESVTIIGLHLAPRNVLEEMQALPEAVTKVKKELSVADIIIAGDLNCGCRYIKPKDFEDLTLYKDPSYIWMIDWCQGPTMVSTWCRYDRLIATGPSLISNGIIYDSGAVYRLDKAFNLTIKQTLKISDHHPIEMQIKPKITRSNKRRCFHCEDCEE